MISETYFKVICKDCRQIVKFSDASKARDFVLDHIKQIGTAKKTSEVLEQITVFEINEHTASHFIDSYPKDVLQ